MAVVRRWYTSLSAIFRVTELGFAGMDRALAA
jgi:hypothetical protein